jgi:ferric-dicitrate binding protein FerR (iron transport regulator)
MTMVLARIGSLRGWRRSPRPRLLALVVLAAALALAGCSGTPASSSKGRPASTGREDRRQVQAPDGLR